VVVERRERDHDSDDDTNNRDPDEDALPHSHTGRILRQAMGACITRACDCVRARYCPIRERERQLCARLWCFYGRWASQYIQRPERVGVGRPHAGQR
jgi:hypothetical protein